MNTVLPETAGRYNKKLLNGAARLTTCAASPAKSSELLENHATVVG